MKDKTVVVLGNARSGTSMTSGLLSIIGVNMHQKHNPQPQNPKGAFEDVNFIHVTAKMHQELNRGFSRQQVAKTWMPRIKEIVGKRSGLWGFKSALTHHNLDTFLPLLKNPHIVTVYRNPLHNAKSNIVHKKDIYKQNITLQDSMDMVIREIGVLHNALKKVKAPKLFTTYEDIKSDPVQEAKNMAKFLGVEFTEEHSKEVLEFIMPEYSTIKDNVQKKK